MAGPRRRQSTLLLFVILWCGSAPEGSYSISFSETDPLLLTPYIDQGEIELARNRSEVHLGGIYNTISYSGYLTVDRKLGNHLFFWHFPSQTDPEAPLLIWLNGGPAVSSMLGLFWEHGPFEVDSKKWGDLFGPRKHSWVGPFSVAYVDNPVGTGYSFTKSGPLGYKLTQEEYTDDLYHFMLQFCELFPEYKTRGVYIGGQSYAGKYVPALAHKIHEHKDGECVGVSLKGVILGGPYFDPPTESVAFFDYLFAVGAISHFDMMKSKTKVRNMYKDFLAGQISGAAFSDLYADLVLTKILPLPSLDNYVTGEDADYEAVQDVMTREDMRKALHVGDVEYLVYHAELAENFGPDVLVSTKSKMAVLMDNYKVLMYNGDYDVVVSSVMIEAAVMTTNWSLQEQYNNTHRIIWRTNKRLKGYYSRTGQFCRVVIHGAGHQTPHDMPDTSLEMVTDFLENGCIVPEN